MIGTSHVVVAARLVRIVAGALTVVVLVGFVAISSFSAQYGSTTRATVGDVDLDDKALAALISEQESAGLTCRERPTLTDTVLFQRRLDTPAIDVLTFEQAVAAATTRNGRVRGYCS